MNLRLDFELLFVSKSHHLAPQTLDGLFDTADFLSSRISFSLESEGDSISIQLTRRILIQNCRSFVYSFDPCQECLQVFGLDIRVADIDLCEFGKAVEAR